MPRASTSIVHPGLLGSLGRDFYDATVKIESSTVGRNAIGEPTDSWSDFLTGLAGRVAPSFTAAGSMVRSAEHRDPEGVWSETTHVIALASHRPTITAAMRAVVGSTTYDILAVEHDGESATTRLLARVTA